MKVLVVYLGILFYCIVGIQNGSAIADQNVTVEISVLKTDISIGDSLSLVCTVNIPEFSQAGEPALKSESSFYDIEKKWQKSTAEGVNPAQVQYGFLLYVFSPDTLHVGPFVVPYITAEGDSGSVESDTITLPVSGIIDNPQSPPQPNRNPLEIASRGIPVWLILILILLFILVTLAIAYIIHRKRASTEQIPDEPIDELEEFERIRRLHLYESGQVKDLYILISFALRGFIQRNMNFDALFETTGEIVKNLSRTSGENQVTKAIREVLEESDKVKFARYRPSHEFGTTVIDRTLEPVKTVLDEIARRKEQESAESDETITTVPLEILSGNTGGK